jgi:hypothetical protein
LGLSIDLVKRANEIRGKIRQIVPDVTPDDVQQRLKAIAAKEMNWSQEDDVGVTRDLRSIANNLDRARRLKRGGVASFSADLQEPVNQLLRELSLHGLFLVPVGELEQWLSPEAVSVSKEKKPEWANAAAAYLRSVEPRTDGIWQFIRSVAKFLSQ